MGGLEKLMLLSLRVVPPSSSPSPTDSTDVAEAEATTWPSTDSEVAEAEATKSWRPSAPLTSKHSPLRLLTVLQLVSYLPN
jgi:hypothetical protein